MHEQQLSSASSRTASAVNAPLCSRSRRQRSYANRAGASPVSLAFPSSGGWDRPATATVPLHLNAGPNTIEIDSSTPVYSPDLDAIEVPRWPGHHGEIEQGASTAPWWTDPASLGAMPSSDGAYDELLAAVQARVNRYANSGDAEDVLDPAGVRDAEVLLGSERAATNEVRHAVGLLFYARHAVLAAVDGEEDMDRAQPLLEPIMDQIPDLVEQIGVLGRRPSQPVRLNPKTAPAIAYGSRPLGEIDTVIAVTRHAILAADDQTDIVPLRMNQAEAHQLRFTRTGEVADLDDAIAIVRSVVADAATSNRLTTLGTFLQLRFAAAGDTGDAEDSIAVMREALDTAAEDDEDRPMYLSNLGRAHLTRYVYVSQDPADLDRALSLIRWAVAATPEGELGRDTRLHALSQAYRMSFARSNDPADLEAALRAIHETVEATIPEHPDRAERILDLGVTHLARHQQSGNRQDAAVVKDAAKQVMRAVPKDHPLYAAARDMLDLLRRRG
ncbi:hypothetical protein AB0M54_28690 [Actinoplanes sp. NPDC051470]|uniref:hypothetical protein n=1 Tax=Actinoplanes sp. NPDC051470 TaxID=3157224 RepID=UPI003413C2AA